MIKNAIKHTKLVLTHKWYVFIYCTKIGLPWRGLVHDMSKFSPTEFCESVKYYDGKISPITVCKGKNGYSEAWLHHKGRNKHHNEYWIDYDIEGDDILTGMKMPINYTVEMFLDRIAASKNYQKEKYTDSSPLEYYENSKKFCILHKETRERLEYLLNMLKNDGEEKTLKYIKDVILKNK